MPDRISISNLRLWTYAGVALLAAGLLAITAGPARAGTFEGYPTAIAYANPENLLKIYEPSEYTSGEPKEFSPGVKVESGTSPSIAGERSSPSITAYEVAFHNPNGHLWINFLGGPSEDTGLGMWGGTSPSMAHWYDEKHEPHHKYVFASEANSSYLWYNLTNTLQGMSGGGTSPSVIPNSDIAFRANTGTLFIWFTALNTGINTQQGIEPGTSPSMTELPGGGYAVAFVAAGLKHLYIYSSNGVTTPTGLGVENGTSPSITSTGGGSYMIAFQGSGTHDLWTYSSSGIATDRGVALYSASSPSISPRAAASWEIAYQTKTHELATYSTITGPVGTGRKMLAASSPSIAP